MPYTVWPKFRPLLLALSLGLNAAFLTAWLVLSAPAWFASEGSDGAEIRPDIYRELGVSGEQWRQLEPLLENFRKEVEQHRAKMNRLRAEMMDIVAASEVDMEALDNKQKEITAAQHEMKKMVINHLLEEKKILTPTQRTKYFKLIKDRCCCAENGSCSGPLGLGKQAADLMIQHDSK